MTAPPDRPATDAPDPRATALNTSLLGPGQQAAARALADLVERGALDPPLALRRAALLHHAGSPRDRRALDQALRLARRRRDLRCAAQALLWQLRWGLESGGPAPTAPPTLPPSLADDPELTADLALVHALCDPPQARRRQEQALDGLPSPARDHDRLDVMVQLACTEREGGDLVRARAWLRRAESLARHHAAGREAVMVALTLGMLELEAGERGAATRALEPALRLGQPDQVEVLAAASVLLALHLDADRFVEAIDAARRLRRCARARHNAIALADAAIGRSTCELRLGRPGLALATLMEAAEECQATGVEAAVNLIRARLAELHVELGPARFEEALRRGGG